MRIYISRYVVFRLSPVVCHSQTEIGVMWSNSSNDLIESSGEQPPSLYTQLTSGSSSSSSSEMVRKLTEQLNSDLAELRREIETNETVYDLTYEPNQQQQQQSQHTSYT